MENYNSAKELSIEDRKTEVAGPRTTSDTGPDGKGTKAAVCIEGKRVATRMGTGPHIQGLRSGQYGPEHNGPVERKGHQQRKSADRVRK